MLIYFHWLHANVQLLNRKVAHRATFSSEGDGTGSQQIEGNSSSHKADGVAHRI